ncbi:unnamed protein product [Triticum turgidum subsp. durum]|uniref:Uncharacterized protein n=1 Tax=Triticum turgidum subsp. durum TaxID=4567 RepID=A0A9R0RNM9_TRITD|nr:unnamed protein product [Triticum turgidum subsp. durum]
MAAVPLNASMGLLNLGGCGVLLPSLQPNSSAGHCFLVPRRDVSAWGLVRRGRFLDAGFRAAGALASGEAGAGSSELRHIEKELTFSPTFTDYVKMMESVKLDRSKSLQGGDSDGRSSRRRFTGDGDASAGRRQDRESVDPRKKSFERNRGAQRDRGGDQGRGERLATNDSAEEFTGLVGKGMVGDVKNSNDGQRKVEEYVQRRIVRGERSRIGDSTDTDDRKQFPSASYVKTRDNKGGVVVHESAGNTNAQSNARKDLQGRATSVVSRTSVTRDSSVILRNTRSTNARSNIQEHDFKYPREGKVSSSEVNADSKFQRYQQRTENSIRNLVGSFRDNNVDYSKPIVSKRYGHTQTVSENYGHRSDSLERGKPETMRMHRGENVQQGKFVRRDSKAVIDDRAAFKTFEAFTDVRNRPRALQMEIEERIQKLASRCKYSRVEILQDDS